MRQTECVSFVSSPELDSIRPVLADAVDLARQALLDLGEGGIGEYLGVTAEDASAATHRFASDLEGYRGWQWAVVVAAPEDADHATVSELVLLPGPDALVAPTWVPWDERIRPGDLGPGDLLSPRQDDPRLVPGYVESGDPAIDEVAGEIGLGRSKVISLEGRLDAAQRWHDGDFGPDTEMAKAAPSTCGLCGFYLPIAGSMSAAFGVCGNEFAADGHVVHAEYGCGAHSDTELPTGAGSPQFEPYDDAALDVIASPVAPVEPAAVAETTDGVEKADTDEAVPEASVPPQEAASEESADEVVAVDEAEPVADDASSATDLAAQEEASASPS
ncbi:MULTISPECIES: DUF3027 domain-containing protein [unclassified Rhodococcus (in: high G+C Gram-positive bacteria)]|uniref:DUF3027 domain-containing protein n=1 Tax=unclassified Rhodococcus (in: high G+C Gram-positive bacteria) TaxID=192944 RepID=UPI0011ED1225|nr:MULTISPECIES: DUF3027 domain-containing protein [unclassified Rhodococcus (in: high G+C Gram-positive bacteria)]KAA0927704.1 DUF3027 domain-containing protein [Rhodococcus sp. ANT_H53B]MDI9928039.1 DUF3027 domain-containing protein [Rhodococcus sp. IEGM 1341]